MIDIKDFAEHLATIGIKDWEKLFGLIDEIRGKEHFGTYLSPSEIVDKFYHCVYELGIITVFDWPSWDEGSEILKNKEQDYNQLNTITLCKLLTAIVRSDRFNEGFLICQFENGVILRIIEALQKHVSNQPLPK